MQYTKSPSNEVLFILSLHYTGSFFTLFWNKPLLMETAFCSRLALNNFCFHLDGNAMYFNKLCFQWINIEVKEIINNYLFLERNRTGHYVSIILDCFLVRSVTIHHILRSNANRNIIRSIRNMSCFHLERYDKVIIIFYYIIQ